MITQDSTLNKQIFNERLAFTNLFILNTIVLCNNNKYERKEVLSNRWKRC